MNNQIRPRGVSLQDFSFKGIKRPEKIQSNYQRRMELNMLEGDKTIAICGECKSYYKKSPTFNVCRKCRH